jgi:hypothetical protein
LGIWSTAELAIRGALNMTFKSADTYRDFARAVREDFRYARTPGQDEFLKVVAATSHSRILNVKEKLPLWRAQLGNRWQQIEKDGISEEVPAAFYPERMKPLAGKASDGRVNPKGIACLYLATQRETAVLEVRPLIGSYVSVAQFALVKDLALINCSAPEIGNLAFIRNDLSHDEVEKVVWSRINNAFSQPVERADDSLDYIPTQIIAETFKLSGFDGIAYKSSYGENGINVALFDPSAADLENCALYRIDDMSVKISQQDNPYFVKRQ